MDSLSPNIPFQAEIAIVEACYAALPQRAELKTLFVDGEAAEARGYYDPVEDERLRETYTRYLGIRSALWEVIQNLKPNYKPVLKTDKWSEINLQAFGIAFSAAEIIVRSGEYLIDLARERDILWKKLDEAEPRYQLARKSFTRLYRQLTSVFTMHRFYGACDFYDANKIDILAALQKPHFTGVSEILTELNLPTASRGDHLRRYRSFVGFSLRRRKLRAVRNILFALFKGTGEDIAELKIPFVKDQHAPKRVTADVIEKLKTVLKPGDVFITRHDDAMSNLFLPGFWPHGAFYVGTAAERDALGVKQVHDKQRRSSEDGITLIEAKKDGVLLRTLEETLQLDAFVVLRPQLEPVEIAKAINNGLSHAGKRYDFIFDFGTSDRLVCTEVIYRAFHKTGDIDFSLDVKAGRNCLSAEDFLNQGVKNNWFKPVIAYGLDGNSWDEGEAALAALRGSFAAEF